MKICLKLGQDLDLRKDRKRIKTSELVEDIVDLVFVGQVCPTDKPKKFSIITKFFGLKKKLVDNISSTINKVHENFDNSNIVKQHQWGV